MFGVRLKMKPDENVTVKFVSSDISEGKITSSNQGTLTFSRDSWNTTQNIEITGQPDGTQIITLHILLVVIQFMKVLTLPVF